MNDLSGIATVMGNVGNIYITLDERTKALEFYTKALEMRKKIGNKHGIAFSLNGLGEFYYNTSQNERALEYFEASKKLRMEIKDREGLGQSLLFIAAVYMRKGDLVKALEAATNSLQLRREIKDKIGLSATLSILAQIATKSQKLDEAYKYASEGLIVSKEIGLPTSILSSAKALKTIYVKRGNYKDAMEMYELEVKMQDSIWNAENKKLSVKKEMEYDYEKKELLMRSEQEKKDLLAQESLKERERERNYFIAGFGLVLCLALFILRGYRQKQKDNKIITHQKHLVEEKQKEILDSIHYAKRIQTALIPSEKSIERTLNKIMNTDKEG